MAGQEKVAEWKNKELYISKCYHTTTLPNIHAIKVQKKTALELEETLDIQYHYHHHDRWIENVYKNRIL